MSTNGYIIFAIAAIVIGVKFADMPVEKSGMDVSGKALLATQVAVPPKRSGQAVAYRKGGHFLFNAMLNGRNVRVLVDTGASGVAINQRTAKRIGLRLSNQDFTGTANTANGTTRFARATIKRIEIGGVTVRNVQAMVLSNDALSETLLGMSFLNKLSRYEFNGNRLTLVQ